MRHVLLVLDISKPELSLIGRVGVPLHVLDPGRNPMPASTQTAHVVKPYTNTSGRQVTTEQQYRSQLLAQLLLRRLRGPGDDEGESEKLAIQLVLWFPIQYIGHAALQDAVFADVDP